MPFEGWSSVITARTFYPTSAKSSIHLLISRFNHSPVIFISGREHITVGIDFFKEVIIKSTISLNKFPSPSCPTKSPLWYWKGFCKYISSTIKTQSLTRQFVFPEAFWQLSLNQLHQMLIFSRHSTKRAVVVLSEEVYTFDMSCTVTLMQIISKYWKI